MLQAAIQRIAESIDSLTEALRAGESLPVLGLRRSARLPVLAALYRRLGLPILLLTDRADAALTLMDELGLWLPEIPRLLFTEPTPLFYENAAWGERTRRDRLVVLTTLASYHLPGGPAPAETAPVIVAPLRAVMTRTLPRREFLKASRSLRQGQVIQPDELVRQWVALGYEAVNTVIGPGQFARRGGILDLWPMAAKLPIRIEFFGDEIDTLRPFEPSTQRTLKSGSPEGEKVFITPAREYLLPPLSAPLSLEGGDGWRSQDGSEHGSEEQPPVEGYSEFYIPVLHPTPASLLDYLPREALVCIDNIQAIQDTATEIEEQAVEMRRDSVREGTLSDQFPVPYLTWTELEDSLHHRKVLRMGPVGEAPILEGEEQPISTRFSPGPRFGGQLKLLMDHMRERWAAGEKLIIVSRQKGRLTELWEEQLRAIRAADPDSFSDTLAPDFVEGSLSEGWIFTPAQAATLHLLTDGEIFGWRRPEPRRRLRPIAETPEAAYADLQHGDLVVHSDHGIGRFLGLVERTIEGITREYLCIEYANEAQLFVPVQQADRLTRYVGPDSRQPSLSTLGSQEWKSAKAHVKEAVQEVAEELLDLYARRSAIQGHAFSPDTPWQQELEASFPYIETDDQMRVLAEVKQDMESPRPMDRLICGDVGYGKTEVALRAAFKAVNDGRQVAVLVPTTVLAQQHYQTFCQRLAAFPVVVEMLSRFRTPQQQKEILERTAAGAVDILIGTHRLLSGDVQFKDLGLLIIDEEQRFGVTHKEKLKKMRTEVDVLTLTATPIPRTLYMTLTGVRDISTINTPPEERLPVVTHVGPYSPKLVRQAILRELERGGQVFFVHNRVQTINAMRAHLEKLVPEARITVAHGQMPENQLSERMEQFTRGEVDVLLSTSIIESGLDIPNANTLIVDRADTFGLAQLYQLRGRVGRGAQRAYAYFFRHNKRLPSPEGRQRLETIAENTQLGAGFNIAMRDLEIRGAGDILGTRQHGQIAAVGFYLYTRLLANAVQRLRKTEKIPFASMPPSLSAELSLPVNVDLPIPASIPADYVPDKTMRLLLYRRIAGLKSAGEIDALVEEFSDRFGPPPEQVHNLLYHLKLKLLAEKAGLASISAEGGQLVLRFPDGNIPAPLPDLGPYVRAGKTALWIPYTNLPNWQEELLSIVGKLEGLGQELVREMEETDG